MALTVMRSEESAFRGKDKHISWRLIIRSKKL